MSGAEPGSCTEPELAEPVDLCTPEGRLNRAAVGWSRQPVHRCALPGSWGRRKRWDYWCVTAPTHVLSLTCADVDYLGLADVWFLDLATGRTASRSAVAPLGRGVSLADRVGAGSVTFEGSGLRLSITEEEAGTRLTAASGRGDRSFECDVVLALQDGHESLSVVIPWSDRRFQCTTKDNSRPAAGWVAWRGEEWTFEGPGHAYGCLDFGRGKWPYRTVWNWGSASGVQDGRTIGLQLGGKWTAGTGMTENALCIDGRLSKVSEELVWEYDPADWLSPWRISTPRSSRVHLTFVPAHDKRSRLELGVAAGDVHQCFGAYSGSVVPDDGRQIALHGLFGWAEEARWRW
jgi:hypothetical protein